jgi:hypothetical protein
MERDCCSNSHPVHLAGGRVHPSTLGRGPKFRLGLTSPLIRPDDFVAWVTEGVEGQEFSERIRTGGLLGLRKRMRPPRQPQLQMN